MNSQKTDTKTDATLCCLHETFSTHTQDESKWLRKIYHAKSNLMNAREITLISEKWVLK